MTPPKLKIAVVLSHFELSGVTTNTVDLCEGLVNIGHDVTLIVGKPLEPHQIEKARYLKSKGVGIKEIPDLHRGKFTRIRTFAALAAELSKGRYDAIHLESIYLSLVPKILGKKFTVTLHSFGLPKNIFAPRATRIIAISDGMKDEAITRHGYKEENIDIVLHGVSPRFAVQVSDDTRSELKRRYGIPEGKIVIGIVGSIQPRKGHHFLLQAVRNLTQDLIDDIHIVFCGNPLGPGNEIWINDKIREFQLQDKVTRIAHTDPLDVYRCLDIFCLPSVWEGFPLVAVEAMLAGNCVIRSDVQGAKEQIKYGVTGFTFKSEDVTDLKRNLEYILTNPDVIKKTGEQGQRFALENFTLNIMAENTAKVYYKILDK